MTLSFYRAFEDRYRGSRELIKSRLKVYLPFISPLQSLYANCTALDVGCGRGEWLELLLEHGFDPQGVDLDEWMLAKCEELQLPAFHGDAITALKTLDDQSLTVVSGFHIVEHIPFESLQQLVAEAFRVLKPAGLLILETPNAENLSVGTHSFYLDPTHEKPIPSQLLKFMTQYAGFARNKVVGLQEDPQLAQAQQLSLMDVLEGVSPDYAVIAQKPAAAWQMVLFDGVFKQTYGLALHQVVGQYDQGIELKVAAVEQRRMQLSQLVQQQHQELEQQRQALEEKLQRTQLNQLEQQQKLEQQYHALEQQQQALAQHQQQLEKELQRSLSWQGVELLKKAKARGLDPKQLIRWPLRKSLAFVLARPHLRNRLNQSLQHIPWLYPRLVRFAQYYSRTAASEQQKVQRSQRNFVSAELPFMPYVQQLSARLKQGIVQPQTQSETELTKPAEESTPKLAFVSPLPTERTGIADYSAELLPLLAQYYEIYVITEQEQVQDAWITAHCQVHNAAWLRAHAQQFERVIYQVGNSHFHTSMLSLMQDVPGVVVLHDFYLSGLFSYVEEVDGVDYAWTDALYESHGYMAVQQRFIDAQAAKYQYPVNLSVLAAAQHILVHSNYSRQLAEQWYGPKRATDWKVIPHLRVPAPLDPTQAVARQQLGLDADSFVICSFGFLNHTKLNHRLLEAWLQSALAQDKQCLLIFVGENHPGDYGLKLRQTIKKHQLQERVRITGFMEADAFKLYLAAADMAVQLRTQSRGESSGTVLDCMNYGLPLIINANGSMAEVDTQAVYMLPDEFENVELKTALETLWRSPEKRQALGAYAKEVILTQHTPASCAQQYVEALEQSLQRDAPTLQALLQQAAAALPADASEQQYLQQAEIIAQQLPPPRSAKRLFLDITATSSLDLKTGIERVARALVLALLAAPPAGYRIEPVYLVQKDGQWVYNYARQYTLELLGSPPVLCDEVVDFQPGDVLLGLDISGQRLIQAQQSGLFKTLQQQSIKCYFMLYDLLPLRLAKVFPEGAAKGHEQWLHAVASLDGVMAISKAVAEDFAQWRTEVGVDVEEAGQPVPYAIDWVHLGADIHQSAPSTGLPAEAEKTLQLLSQRPTFLMVGTIEPRKNYLQTLKTFSLLWERGVDVNLVIVGREGWQHLANSQRRDIPQTIELLSQHTELGKRLFWLDGISDEYLEKIYAASSCLIAASRGEGFGLPLIEAAQHKLPIIARDIPIFREVAGEHAFYFEGVEPIDLADAIQEWLSSYQLNTHPKSDNMPWLTWQQSAQQLVTKLDLASENRE